MIPVPLPGILPSVRALAPVHLFMVVRYASKARDPGKSWPPDALRAYGIAACRELEIRALDKGLSDSVIAFLCGGFNRGARKTNGRVPSIVVRYQAPSWIKTTELHARHRAALLRTDFREHYVAEGWREQTEIVGAGKLDFALPPHDPKAPISRWQFDTSKDW